MKFDKWTVVLAAAGIISLPSLARAEEKPNSVLTDLSSTTLSGYVDTSAQWNFGTGDANLPPYRFGGSSKADGFNLDVVQLRIDKPLNDAEWAAGYRVDLWMGPDANSLGTQSVFGNDSFASQSDFAIRQAYVKLRMPIGNGIVWKAGVFDSLIGYESVESPLDPNYTRSYGNSIEPQTHTGIVASYDFTDLISASFGVADTVGPIINDRAQLGATGFAGGPLAPLFNFAGLSAIPGSNRQAESDKTYMGAIALTAPQSMGFLAGSTLYGGIVNGFNNSFLGSGAGDKQTSYYLGATVATPISDLRLGAAFDYLDAGSTELQFGTIPVNVNLDELWSVAGYASYQLTPKLSVHGRLEYFKGGIDANIPGLPGSISARERILAATATLQYDLWNNVISRLEFRWDHSLTGNALFGGAVTGVPTLDNAYMLAANIIYQF